MVKQLGVRQILAESFRDEKIVGQIFWGSRILLVVKVFGGRTDFGTFLGEIK